PVLRDRMLVVPGGWKRFLGVFVLACGGVAGSAYLYGLATRPLRAGRYAVTMGTHVFMWVVIVLVFYPVVYLLSVSFNENNTLATALPRVGNLIVRAGVIPDPARVSTIQYVKVTREFHVHWYQLALFGVLLLSVLGVVSPTLAGRLGRATAPRLGGRRRGRGPGALGDPRPVLRPDRRREAAAREHRRHGAALHPQHAPGVGHDRAAGHRPGHARRVRVLAAALPGALLDA